MARRQHRRRASDEHSTATQYLSLSLFIMLLAFFIVLNTISKYEDRQFQPIIRSLEGAFSTDAIYKNKFDPSVAETVEKSINEGNTADRIEALFNSIIPNNKIIKNKLTGVLHVSISWRDFEKAIMELSEASEKKQFQVVRDEEFLLPALVALLMTEKSGTAYHMDVVLNITNKPSNLQNRSPRKLAQTIKKVTVVSDLLEEAGLPSKLMSVGLQKGKIDVVELYFRRYVAFNPLGNDNLNGRY